MKLKVLERILISQLLPEKNSFLLMEEAECLRIKLSISPEENKAIDFRLCADWDKNGCPQCGSTDVEKKVESENQLRECNKCDFKGAQGVNGAAVWKEPKEQTEITFSDGMVECIASKLKAFDEKGEIKREHISLYKKFVTGD